MVFSAAAAAADFLDASAREACEADLVTLQPCTKGNAENNQLCCAAVKAFNSNGCFCGWGPSVRNPEWAVSTLVGLQALFAKCTGVTIACEGTLLDDVLGHTDFLPEDVQVYPLALGGAEQEVSNGAVAAVARMQAQLDAMYPDAAPTAQDSSFTAHWNEVQELTPMGDGSFKLEVEFEEQYSGNPLVLGMLGSLGGWLAGTVGRVVQGAEVQGEVQGEEVVDPMDRTDDLDLLMGSLMHVLDEMTHKLDADEFNLSVEVTIERKDDEPVSAQSLCGTGCQPAWASYLPALPYMVWLAAVVSLAAVLCRVFGAAQLQPVLSAFRFAQPGDAEEQQAVDELRKPLLGRSH